MCFCTTFPYERDLHHHFYHIYLTFQEGLEVNRVITVLKKTHNISKVQFNASLHGLHPRCTEHRLITVEAYPRPLFLKKQEGPTHDIKSAITSYKVKNMSLFLTFSVSWGLQVRLGISRRADHTIRGPHLLLSPCEADLLRQSGNRVEGSVAWHSITTPRSCTPASWLGLDSSNLPWCFMEATSARRHYEQKTWHMVVWSSVHGWLGPPMLLCWEPVKRTLLIIILVSSASNLSSRQKKPKHLYNKLFRWCGICQVNNVINVIWWAILLTMNKCGL